MGADSRRGAWWGKNSETEGQDSTVPIINVNAQEGQSSSSSVTMLLADSCPEDSELKKDASFLDDLGKWRFIHWRNIDSFFTIYEQFQKKICCRKKER